MKRQETIDFGTERSSDVLRAGFEVFAHYGYKKTSMDQIAEVAGMSRPALYQYYQGKKAIFVALARLLQQQAYQQVEAVCAEQGMPIRQRMRGCVAARDFWLLSVLMRSAHGMEFVSAVETLSGDINREYREKFRSVLLEAVESAEQNREVDFAKVPTTAERWTDAFILALRGGEQQFEGLEALTETVEGLLDIFLGAVQPRT